MKSLAERILGEMFNLKTENSDVVYQRIRTMCEDTLAEECKHVKFMDRLSQVKLIEKELDIIKRKGEPFAQKNLSYVYPLPGEMQFVASGYWLLLFHELKGYQSRYILPEARNDADIKARKRMYERINGLIALYRARETVEIVTIDRRAMLAYEKMHKEDDKKITKGGYPVYPIEWSSGKAWFDRRYLNLVFKFFQQDDLKAEIMPDKRGLFSLRIRYHDGFAIVMPIKPEEEELTDDTE